MPKTDDLPPCGLYRTTRPLGAVPADRLVSFHNHGDPGPGVYLPASWTLNKATFQERGHTLPEPWAASARTLEPVPAQGFYRVARTFHCCARQCRQFAADLIVQLGYDGEARPILFVPELSDAGIAVPEVGTPTDLSTLEALVPVRLQQGGAQTARTKHAGDLH